jgi:hypothetical protein
MLLYLYTVYSFLYPKFSRVLPNYKKSLQFSYHSISSFSFLILDLLDLLTDSKRFLIFDPFEYGSIPDPYKILKEIFMSVLIQEKAESGSHFFSLK